MPAQTASSASIGRRGELLAAIKAVVGELPTYGYQAHSSRLSNAKPSRAVQARPNHKRVYRVMKLHGVLLDRHAGGGVERRHDGRIAVDERNRRWCSDRKIGCDNGGKVRVRFSLDCYDREAMSVLMVAAVEHRFGRVNRLPVTIEWLSDNVPGGVEQLHGLWYKDHARGMLERDIQLRLDSLKQKPDNVRHWFYSAQSYRNAGRALEAAG